MSTACVSWLPHVPPAVRWWMCLVANAKWRRAMVAKSGAPSRATARKAEMMESAVHKSAAGGSSGRDGRRWRSPSSRPFTASQAQSLASSTNTVMTRAAIGVCWGGGHVDAADSARKSPR